MTSDKDDRITDLLGKVRRQAEHIAELEEKVEALVVEARAAYEVRDAARERIAALQKEVKEGDEYGEEANTERSELKCEVYTLREAISTQAKRIAALEAKLATARVVAQWFETIKAEVEQKARREGARDLDEGLREALFPSGRVYTAEKAGWVSLMVTKFDAALEAKLGAPSPLVAFEAKYDEARREGARKAQAAAAECARFYETGPHANLTAAKIRSQIQALDDDDLGLGEVGEVDGGK